MNKQVHLLSTTLVEDPFEDNSHATHFLRENIGTLFTCFAAAGAAKVDLIELVKSHQQQEADKIKNQ